jgi:hypothetical protein
MWKNNCWSFDFPTIEDDISTSLEDVMNELTTLNLVIMYIKELPYPFLGMAPKSRNVK